MNTKQNTFNPFGVLLVVILFLMPAFVQAQLKYLQQVNELPPHPRILLFAGEELKIKENIAADPVLNKIHQVIMGECERILLQPELQNIKLGRRLLQVSQEALQRIFYLSYAYRIYGDEKYLLKAEKEMLSIATFSDWNPSHFLDVAEMTMAMAIGYDWLYEKLSPVSRELIKSAILRNGIDPSLNRNFATWTNNWGQVCNAGITYGALALFEDFPELSKLVIDRAVETIRTPMRVYDPDGAYPEGFEYWVYGTSFNLLFISAIEKALKTDYGLSELPGFMKTADYYLNMTGPSDTCFNYADCDAQYMTRLHPSMFWFASKLDRTSLLWVERRHIENERFEGLRFAANGRFVGERLLPTALIWASHLRLSDIQPPTPGETIWVGHGTTPVALMRTSWTDPKAIFVGFKAGRGNAPHGHIDAGSFVMEANGVRWASDFGHQEYTSLEEHGVDLWNMGQNSQRWQVFRYNNFAHNTLTVNDQLHTVSGASDIVSWSADASFMNAVIDLSKVFEGQLSKSLRGVAIVDRQYVAVRDEITTTDKEATVRWTMLTAAKARITGKNSIELTKDGKKLTLQVVEPAKVTMKTWTTTSPNVFDYPNPGTILVGFEVNVPAGTSMALTVKLIPQNAKQTSSKLPELKEWMK